MPHYRAHFWHSGRVESDVVYRCRARSLPDMRKALAVLYARHQGARSHSCLLDGWSILAVASPTNLYRIVMAGGVLNGQITNELPADYRMANRHPSRQRNH